MRFVEKADLIFNECDRIGGMPVGTAVITSGGRLKARHVIHAVCPRMGEGNEDDKLRSATLSSLRVAEDNGLHSIAFPAISTGIFGFPLDRCARIMVGSRGLSAKDQWTELGGVLLVFCGCL